jgi:hypothetical protein
MKIQTALIIIFSIILLPRCTPDCEKNAMGSPQNLPKTYFGALFPYKGDEKLKFLKNGKDTVIFYNLGFTDGYNYITSQTDCPTKIPLQYKTMTFIDSIGNNYFKMANYESSNYYTEFMVIINDKILFQDEISEFIILTAPYISLDIGKNHYDTLTYSSNNDNYFYYKTYTTGMVKFKIDNDVFELLQ